MVAIHNLTETMFRSVHATRSRRRTMREWAEDEVVLPPTGPSGPVKFRCARQPITGVLLDELGSDRWRRAVVAGPSQSGKTLGANVIPTLYVADELKETIVYGVPEADMADDKYKTDMLPVMMNSPRLRGLIPQSGPGSKGGAVRDRIDLPNGTMIKIMTANASDTGVAGFTSRWVIVTEAAGFSANNTTSTETHKFGQLEARQRAFPRRRRRTIIEGTLTNAEELPWRLRGTEDDLISTMSQLLSPCPHCPAWISPTRADFLGWEDAKTATEAMDLAAFYCPSCGQKITEEERIASLQHVQLVHHGQHVNARGEVVGELPSTETLWFHWSQWHNLLLPSSDHAAEEWEKERTQHHSENWLSKEKELCQFIWSIPYDPPGLDIVPLTEKDVYGTSLANLRRGIVPPETVKMSAGVDIRGTQLHYCVIAWRGTGSGHVVDVGIVPIQHKKHGSKRAILTALRKLRDEILEVGYKADSSSEKVYKPQVVFIDAGWNTDVVRLFVRECLSGGLRRYFPSFGRGQSQPKGKGSYVHPQRASDKTPFIGEEMHLKRDVKHELFACWINSDVWKTNVHDAFATPADQPGTLGVFHAVTDDETTLLGQYCRQIVAEKQQEMIVPGRGTVTVWKNTTGRQNHFLDTTYLALGAGHLAGVRVVTQDRGFAKSTPKPIATTQPRFTTPSGQPFLVTSRS